MIIIVWWFIIATGNLRDSNNLCISGRIVANAFSLGPTELVGEFQWREKFSGKNRKTIALQKKLLIDSSSQLQLLKRFVVSGIQINSS